MPEPQKDRTTEPQKARDQSPRTPEARDPMKSGVRFRVSVGGSSQDGMSEGSGYSHPVVSGQ